MIVMNGIINVYKEKGYTSHDVVARLRGILHYKKIGHTGTLDPDAVGVLPVCVGNATKVCDVLTDRDKVYHTVLKLGMTTDTYDTSGEVLSTSAVDATRQEIEEAVMAFVGSYEQLPPMYSAIKINGVRLYELARQGITVERKKRLVTIRNIRITDIDMENKLVSLDVECSKGTYIRSLCKDIGDVLGCGGCMSELTRTRVGRFVIEEAMKLDEIEAVVKDGRVDDIMIAPDAIFDYPKLQPGAEYDKALRNGNTFSLKENASGEEKKYLVYDSDDRFIGIYQCAAGVYKPVKMFLS